MRRYVEEWIQGIDDITPLARRIHGLLEQGDRGGAAALLPEEKPYPIPEQIKAVIGTS